MLLIFWGPRSQQDSLRVSQLKVPDFVELSVDEQALLCEPD